MQTELNDQSTTALKNELKTKLSGQVFAVGEAGYDESRSSWNLLMDHRPIMVAVAESEADVQAAVVFANDKDLPVAVHVTGHGAPRPSNSGILVNLSKLNSVTVDERSKSAKIGGGAVWRDVVSKTTPLGLVPISGSAPHVGVVGYTLGGGYGLLSRKYGLAADNVKSFRIVTPNGECRQVDPQSDPDLYRAVLGGGGAYGVLTEIEIALHPHAELFGGSVMFDAAHASAVYAEFAKWTRAMPEEVSLAISVMTFPPVPFIPEFLHGRSMVIVAGTALAPQATAEEWLAPIRNFPGAEFDSFRTMKYDESGAVFNDPVEPLPATGRGVLLCDFDEKISAALLEAIGPIPKSPNLMIQMRHLEGAISRQPLHTNAVGERRNAKYLLYLLGVPMGPVTLPAIADHAEHVFKELEPYIVSRGPLNWIGEANVKAAHIRENFSEAEFHHLAQIKKTVDPDNRFRFAGVGVED